MPAENPFDAPFGAPPELPRIDAGAVVRRSRRRRRVRQVAVGGVAGLAVIGAIFVVGPNLATVLPVASGGSASVADGAAAPDYSSGGSTAGGTDSGKGASAEPEATCGAKLPSPPAASPSIVVSVGVENAANPSALASGTASIRVTNSTGGVVQLAADDPIVVVGRDGVVRSTFALEDAHGRATSQLAAGATELLSGSLTEASCAGGVGAGVESGDSIVVLLPLIVDGRTVVISVVPTSVTIH